MKKRQNLILQSFGAAGRTMPAPKADELAKWIQTPRPKKTDCDITTYFLERQLRAQAGFADILGCGGGFYASRLLESIGGHKEGYVSGELYAIPDMVKADAESVKALQKTLGRNCTSAPLNFVLPSPSALKLNDAFYGDIGEYYSAICEVYAKIMREQRDLGVKRHIIRADLFAHDELEELSRERVFFLTPAPTSRQLSSILEYQTAVALCPSKLPVLFELTDEYEVREVCLINAKPSDFEPCLEHFDPDCIKAGGIELWQDAKTENERKTKPKRKTEPDNASETETKKKTKTKTESAAESMTAFWKDLKENSYLMRD
ncbi:MAG: hypothetical protein II925_01605 [Methanomicrobium sp.]|nr:hypothetical protein [Methanomicrobium sp.]MBQ4415487.1 hypothetical protein [Methanomicrobium sp.]